MKKDDRICGVLNYLELENEVKGYLELKKYFDLFPRICEDGQIELKKNKVLIEKFNCKTTQHCTVLSIDIRKSTELMKESKPDDFAIFISSLMLKFESIVKENFGVFDKFTGDGMLAFFPNFFSGEDSVFFAMKVADECHKAFAIIFEKFVDSFKIVSEDIGLGIGIDFGDVVILSICGKLTVVGIPVVYACRFNSGLNKTYLNQGAMTRVKEFYANNFTVQSVSVPIKNQSSARGYIVGLDFKAIEPKFPDWYQKNKKV